VPGYERRNVRHHTFIQWLRIPDPPDLIVRVNDKKPLLAKAKETNTLTSVRERFKRRFEEKETVVETSIAMPLTHLTVQQMESFELEGHNTPRPFKVKTDPLCVLAKAVVTQPNPTAKRKLIDSYMAHNVGTSKTVLKDVGVDEEILIKSKIQEKSDIESFVAAWGKLPVASLYEHGWTTVTPRHRKIRKQFQEHGLRSAAKTFVEIEG